MKHNRFFILIVALLLSGLLAAQAVGNAMKDDGIGGTGAPARDGIGGTGAPARDGIGGTGAPARDGIGGTGTPARDGIGGTGLRPNDKFVAPRIASLAGRVLFIAGQVEAENRGQVRALVKGDSVRVGDTLKSGSGASLQLYMEDGGTIVLRPESQLLIESFAYNGMQDGSEHMALSLLTGGFRAVTGNIGHLHKDHYSIRTPNATISIRGTDHEAVFVPRPRAGQTAVVAPGTYDHVISGATVLKNERGELLIKPNQTGFVALKEAEPIIIKQTLPIFGDQKARPEKSGQAHDDINNSDQQRKGSAASSDQNTEQHSGGGYTSGGYTPDVNPRGLVSDTEHNSSNPTQNAQQNIIIQSEHLGNTNQDLNTLETNGSPAPAGNAVVGAHLSMLAVGSAQAGNPGVTLLAEENYPGSYANNVSGFNFIANEAEAFNQGSAHVDGVTVTWGIYAGGIAFDTTGKAIAINFHPFAYAIAGATPATVISTMSGTATFSNMAGYTRPVTESGNTGGSVNLNVGINLGASTVTSYNLTVTDANARNWNGGLVNGTPVALAAFANGTPLAVTCGGCSSGIASGRAAGLLIGPNAKGLISSYVLSTTTGKAVSGAVILSRP